MRMIVAFPILLVAACNVDNDSANDQVTLEYNQQRIEEGAADAANTAGAVASSVGNVATSAGRAIENEVGDIDVDLDVRRNASGNSN